MAQEDLGFEMPVEALSRAQAEAQAGALRRSIQRHNYLYHVQDRPEISDAEFDELFERLLTLEHAHPHVATPDSPSQRVGAEPRDDLPTVAHTAPMLSLDSTKDEDELRRFDERMRKTLGGPVAYLVEPKLDGASLELVYEDGLLMRAVTRGNGQEGEGVTENVRTIPSVPLRLRDEVRAVPSLLAIRGEVLMYLSAFEALNQQLVEKGSDPFANPRNASAGALRQLDSRVTAQRPLDLLAFDILTVSDAAFGTDREVVAALQDWGFKVPERVELLEEVDGILGYHKRFFEDRDDFVPARPERGEGPPAVGPAARAVPHVERAGHEIDGALPGRRLLPGGRRLGPGCRGRRLCPGEGLGVPGSGGLRRAR